MPTTKKCEFDQTVWHRHKVGWWGKKFVDREGNRICTYRVRNDYVWRCYYYGRGWSGWMYSRTEPTVENGKLVYPHNKIDYEYHD